MNNQAISNDQSPKQETFGLWQICAGWMIALDSSSILSQHDGTDPVKCAARATLSTAIVRVANIPASSSLNNLGNYQWGNSPKQLVHSPNAGKTWYIYVQLFIVIHLHSSVARHKPFGSCPASRFFSYILFGSSPHGAPEWCVDFAAFSAIICHRIRPCDLLRGRPSTFAEQFCCSIFR